RVAVLAVDGARILITFRQVKTDHSAWTLARCRAGEEVGCLGVEDWAEIRRLRGGGGSDQVGARSTAWRTRKSSRRENGRIDPLVSWEVRTRRCRGRRTTGRSASLCAVFNSAVGRHDGAQPLRRLSIGRPAEGGPDTAAGGSAAAAARTAG